MVAGFWHRAIKDLDYKRKLHVPIATSINVRCVVCQLELYRSQHRGPRDLETERKEILC